jgi:transposase InsO family protein
MRQKGYQPRAISRFMAVSVVRSKIEQGMSLARAIAEASKQSFFDVDGREFEATRRSLYRWIAEYRDRGIDGLCDKARTKTDISPVLSEDFIKFLVNEKTLDPEASIPEVIRRAEVRLGMDIKSVSRSTVWRAANRLNLRIFRNDPFRKNTMRPFAYANRMRMVLCDGKHFRAGKSRAKRVVFIFLDDATRFGLRAVVGTSENPQLFLRGLYLVICRYGMMVCMYMDNGSGFQAHDVWNVGASLDIGIIYGSSDYPEGRGKIERFNRTLQADLLRHLDENPEVDPDPGSLELLINHYITETYNKKNHDAFDNESPFTRFSNDPIELKPVDTEALQKHFYLKIPRRVTRDNTIKYRGDAYEMPLGYSGKNVELERDTIANKLFFYHNGKRLSLSIVDLTYNAKMERSKNEMKNIPRNPTDSAAMSAFKRDYGPIPLDNMNQNSNKSKKD